MSPDEEGARRARIRAWAPAAGYALLISAFSHQSAIQPPRGSPDWLLHGAEFAVLGALVARAIRLRGAAGGAAGWLAAGAGCLLFGLLDEWHQSFIPGRTAALADAAADGTGALVGLALGALLTRPAAGAASEVLLLGRPGCHLCDEAESVIRSVLRETGGRFSKRCVDDDPIWRERYGAEIPVVLIDGRKRFKHRVERAPFERAMRSRAGGGAE